MPTIPLNFKLNGLLMGLVLSGAAFFLYPTYLLSVDFYKNWTASTTVEKRNFVTGFASGITWRHTIDHGVNCGNNAALAAQQEAICLVMHSEKLPESTSIVRVMEQLYSDPANAELHYDLIFFVATAKLLSLSEAKSNEALEIFRRNPKS
jgi:hypothetical protein